MVLVQNGEGHHSEDWSAGHCHEKDDVLQRSMYKVELTGLGSDYTLRDETNGMFTGH